MNDKVITGEKLNNPVITFQPEKLYRLEYGFMIDSGTWKVKSDSILVTTSKVSNNITDKLVIVKLTPDTFRIKKDTGSETMILTLVPYIKSE